MKIPTTLLHRVLLDEGLQVGLTIERDYKEICSRFKDEGMSFLTIALPLLSDALERGLSEGRIVRGYYPGFRSCRRSESLPALLSGFFMRVFERDGRLRTDPCIASIRAIRQITRLFKKVELPCSSARRKAAYERYQSNDEGLCWSRSRCSIDIELLARVSGHLWSDLESLSGELYCNPGKFGSGATAERLLFNERHSVLRWPSRSEPWFPSDFHATYNFTDGLDSIEFHDESDELPVRVVQVPKTLKTPRTISVEPSYMMLMQQSVAEPLVRYLEGSRFPFKSIRFTDQSVNQELARLGSIDGKLSTIDLSDASDLVSNDLVSEIFKKVAPTFLDLVQACRSSRAQLPDGTILPLRKFASMGSALCFPMEAMVFFTIIMYSIVRQSGRAPSFRYLIELGKQIAVYGDDIIVPTTMVTGVMEDLELFGLKVNQNKSYCQGFFRESCGGDYYKGVDVTPTYVRQWDFTGSLREASHLVAYVSLSNQLYVKGMWHACQSVREVIDRRFRLPYARGPRGYLFHASFARESGLVWNRDLCGYRVRSVSVCAVKQADSPTSFAGFMLRTVLPLERGDRLCASDASKDIVLGVLPRGRNSREDSEHHRPRFRGNLSSRGYVESYLRDEKVSAPLSNPAIDFARMSQRALRAEFRRISTLRNVEPDSAYTSVRAYTLKSKCRWHSSHEGLLW